MYSKYIYIRSANMEHITKAQARRFLLLKHGLLGDYKFDGKQGIVDYVTQCGCVQYDPIDVCGKNHELILFSKIKDFSKDKIYDLLYKDRVLMDWFDKCMSITLMSDWPYFEQDRENARHATRSKEEVDEVADEILEYIKENGATCSSDIKFDKKVSWYWAPTSLSRAALDMLYFKGELVLHHKKNTRKYYDLAQRHIDEQFLNKPNPNKNLMEILTWNVKRRIGSVGMLHNNASYAFIGVNNLKTKERNEIYTTLLNDKTLTEVKVEGIKNSFYYLSRDKPIMDMAVSDRQFEKRVEFLGPLDNIIWDRKIIIELFDFDYKWEIYTPLKDRKYGYYVLPVLYGEELIGRIELRRDKKAKNIAIKNIWIDTIDADLKYKIDDKAKEVSCVLY